MCASLRGFQDWKSRCGTVQDRVSDSAEQSLGGRPRQALARFPRRLKTRVRCPNSESWRISVTEKTRDVRQIAYCPHCGNKATQSLVFTQLYYEKSYSLSEGREDEYPAQSFVVRCETCCQLLIYIDDGAHCEDNQFHRAELRWPHSGRLDLRAQVPAHSAWLHHTRLEVRSPRSWRWQRPVGDILCDREIMSCPHPVLCIRLAERLGLAN
jgi:hypothetical protein